MKPNKRIYPQSAPEQGQGFIVPDKKRPYANLTIDVAFKKVFTNEEMLLGLLIELLPELHIVEIIEINISPDDDPLDGVVAEEKAKDSNKDKEPTETYKEDGLNKKSYLKFERQEVVNKITDRRATMDIVCSIASGERITIEMQNKDSTNVFPDRTLYYATLEIQEQVEIGGGYELKPLYVISFMNFNMLSTKTYISRYSFHNDETLEKYEHNKLNFIYIELLKFCKSEAECVTRLDKLLYTLKYSSMMKKVPKSFESDDYIKKMFNFALFANFTPAERKLYQHRMYTAQEYRAIIQKTADENLAAGMAAGLAEGRAKLLDTARNMLKAGLDVKLVMSCTGLTEAEVIALQQN